MAGQLKSRINFEGRVGWLDGDGGEGVKGWMGGVRGWIGGVRGWMGEEGKIRG